MSESSKTQLSMDDLDTTENSAASQGNISRELAHKIWRVTPSDISLGIPEPTVPTYPFIGGVDWGSGGSSSSKHPANDAATAFISEVERALYADSTGYPENGTPNYFKAAENYAIYGDNFLDFPKDTSTCFAGLGSTGRSTSNPPPGFERSARSSALYERRQTPSQAGSPSTPNFSGHQHQQHRQQSQQQRHTGTDCNNNNHNANANANTNPNPNHNPNSRISGSQGSNINEIPFPQIYHQLFSQSPPQAQSSSSHHQHPNHSHNQHQQHSGASQSPQQQHHHQQHHQQRGGGGAASGGDHHGGHPPTNEISLSQLYQQLMARNLRTNHLHQHHQQQQQQTNSNAAAAAMIYANLELQQQMQLRQLQLQQLHQQQQQQARLPRGIYGGNNGQGTGGAAPPTGGKEPQTGNHK